MSRKVLFAGAAAFVLAALALAAAYFYVPGGVRPSFGEGDIQVFLNSDGTIELSWPEAVLTVPAEGSEAPENPEEAPTEPASVFYHLEILSGGERYNGSPAVPQTLLDDIALPMDVQIQAVTEGKNLLGTTRRLTSPALRASVEGTAPDAPQAVGSPEPGNLSLSWKFSGQAPGFYEVFALDPETGGFRPAASTSEKQIDLKIRKKDGDLALPSYEHPMEIHVRGAVQGEGYVLCGPASNLIRVERQDLLGDDLNLAFRETDPRHYALEWDETRGEYYELQEWTGEDWTLLETLEPAESFTVELGLLGSGSHHRYQVTARDRSGDPRSAEEVEFYASVSPLYATVWPITDQSFYEKAGQDAAVLGKIPAGTALCVLEESGEWFQVRYKDQYGWVDSRFCMINLPEYTGDHCAYDIANSYSSIFKVHENPIALITEQVIKGFEHIQTADEQFLVPYLYPCSQKLLRAAQAAEADGYRLKIYEAFRPNEATRFLYDTTASQLEWAALVYDEEGGNSETSNAIDPVTGWVVDLSDGLLTDPETEEKISREDLALRQAEEAAALEEAALEEGDPNALPSSPETPGTPAFPFFTLPEEGEGGSLAPEEAPPPQPEAPAESEPPAETPQEGETPEEAETPEESKTPEEGETPEEETPEYDTYFTVMTNGGRFSLGSFLARVASAHNRGIALDLTLETLRDGEELEMQSAMHDLSWYSAAYLNNDSAKLLEKYMTGTGMRGLSSEWWHFQDDETREAIGLTSYLSKGVHMGGWTRDSRGWRYRDEDGTYFRGTSVTVDGKRYTLDSEGYVVE
ncbi:M15 family metallopeptidase [Oscillospiraceae bacterium 38-13]